MADSHHEKSTPDARTWLRSAIPISFAALLIAMQLFGERKPTAPALAYSSFYSLAEQGKVARVTITGQVVTGSLKETAEVEGKRVHDFSTVLPGQEDHDLLPLLRAQHVDVRAEPEQPSFGDRFF